MVARELEFSPFQSFPTNKTRHPANRTGSKDDFERLLLAKNLDICWIRLYRESLFDTAVQGLEFEVMSSENLPHPRPGKQSKGFSWKLLVITVLLKHKMKKKKKMFCFYDGIYRCCFLVFFRFVGSPTLHSSASVAV